MKSFFISILIIYQSNLFFCQEIISTSGANFSSNGNQLSWTIGELVSETTTNSTGILTQGFQQSYSESVGLMDVVSISNIKIYPNPFSDYIIIESSDIKNDVLVTLFDNENRIILKEQKKMSNPSKININLESISSGIYFLKINSAGIETFYQLVKL